MRGLDADVLALQEVDRNQPRSHGADLTAVAAEAMGAVDHRFVAALSGRAGAGWVAATGAEQPDAAAYGIALLSRHPVTAWRVVRLPALPAPVPMRSPGSRMPTLARDEPRVAVAADVETPEGPVTVANTHLSFVHWSNRRQLRHLVRSLAPARRPLVLMGDLNMGPGRAASLTGMRALAVAPDVPRRRTARAARPRAGRRRGPRAGLRGPAAAALGPPGAGRGPRPRGGRLTPAISRRRPGPRRTPPR